MSRTPRSLETPFWEADKEVVKCSHCHEPFSFLNRRHHCRQCGRIFCWKCSQNRLQLEGSKGAVRVCDPCVLYMSQSREWDVERFHALVLPQSVASDGTCTRGAAVLAEFDSSVQLNTTKNTHLHIAVFKKSPSSTTSQSAAAIRPRAVNTCGFLDIPLHELDNGITHAKMHPLQPTQNALKRFPKTASLHEVTQQDAVNKELSQTAGEQPTTHTTERTPTGVHVSVSLQPVHTLGGIAHPTHFRELIAWCPHLVGLLFMWLLLGWTSSLLLLGVMSLTLGPAKTADGSAPPPSVRVKIKLHSAPQSRKEEIDVDALEHRNATLPTNAAELHTWFTQSMQSATLDFQEDRLYEAKRQFYGIRVHLRRLQSEAGGKDLANVARQCEQQLDGSGVWKQVQERVKEVSDMLREMSDHDGWNLVRDGTQKVWYRKEEGLDTHSFKCSGIINASLFQVAACLYEIDLFSTWFPFMVKSEIIGVESRFKKLAYLSVNIPWLPFNARDACILGYGVDNSAQGKLVVFVRSVRSHPKFELPAVEKGHTMVDIHSGGFYLQHAGPNRTRVCFLMNCDPKVAIVPYWMVNFVTGRLIHSLFPVIEKTLCFDDNSVFAQRIQENREVYEYMERSCQKAADPDGQ